MIIVCFFQTHCKSCCDCYHNAVILDRKEKYLSINIKPSRFATCIWRINKELLTYYGYEVHHAQLACRQYMNKFNRVEATED